MKKNSRAYRMTLVALMFFISLMPALAQQPAYFVLGENQFKGLKVFDIIQDFEQNYYFATNEGIVKYDFIKYTKVEVKSAKSVAFFNLTINRYGAIYFNNLNNQIFEIKKGKCKLFYELQGVENSNLIHLTNDNNGNLLIGCKGLVVLDTTAKIVIKKFSKIILNTSYQFNASSWIFPVSATKTVLFYTNGKITERSLLSNKDKTTENEMLQFFNYKDSSYALDLISKTLFYFDKNKWQLTPLKINDFFNSSTNARIFITGNNIWSPSSISGINCGENGFGNVYQKFYPEYFISEVFQDKEGNILVGTFDKGVLVIPNLKIPDVINPFTLDPIISLYAGEEDEVYIGSNKGILNVYKDNKLINISSSSKKPIEGIYGSSISDYLVFDDEKIKCYNKRTLKIYPFSRESLKDVAFVSAIELYIGTNFGVSKVKLKPDNTFDIEFIKDQNFRIYSLAYDINNGVLYSSSAKGLFKIDKLGVSQKLYYKGKDIFSEKIIFENGILYVISREFGILAIKNQNDILEIKPHFSNADESVKGLKIYKNTIIASTSYGLYQISHQGEILNQFHSTYGFSSKKVYNFTISNDDLWVSHLGGVQKVDLSYNSINKPVPQVNIKSLFVNNLEVDFGLLHKFESMHRKFEFVVYSPTIRNIESIKFHYKLIGYDDQWQIQSSKFNNIVYNALAPGSYTLVIKAESFGKFSEEKKYRFTILKPFYAQWWFVLTAIALFFVLIYLIYRRQLNIQKRKSKQINELNLSKLTAIQSQMNPHFIFNSLNSIQDLVLQQNATKAYDSIGKFALLIRKIMYHSEKEFIDIEEELSILNVYLEMELLRIKKDFSYTINSNDISDIEIPPMLIQPYIENAIKHGLLHKPGEKKLIINMQLKNDVFVCEIIDNGIGRAKSEEIKQRQNKLYESFSGNSLHKRLAILKKHFGGDFGVEIIDLYDKENIAVGTKVILIAPYKRKF